MTSTHRPRDVARASPPRRAIRRRNGARWLSIALAIGVFAAATLTWQGLLAWERGRTVLVFEHDDGTVPPLQLAFFPSRVTFASPSPPPAIATAEMAAGGSFVAGREQIPGHALLRYRGEGVGTGCVFVELGQVVPPIRLRPPARLAGRVGAPVGFWWYGWRTAGYRAVPDAEVTVLGGGDYGADLATARTDGEGRFELQGFDAGLDALVLRVRADGHATRHDRLVDLQQHTAERLLVTLQRAPARRGRILIAPDATASMTTLLVLARGLPGVQAAPAVDGSFVLHGVPTMMEPSLQIHGLPPTCAQPRVVSRGGEESVIRIVAGSAARGRVLDGATWLPVAGALVWCGDGEAVRSDGDGRYELTHLVPGEVELSAQVDPVRRRDVPRLGRRAASLQGGVVQDGLDILVGK